MKTTTITIKVPQKLRAAFKMVALRREQTMTEILIEAIKKAVEEDVNVNI